MFIDLAFILYDVGVIIKDINTGCGDINADLLALGLDVGGALIPFATGLGAMGRVALRADDVADIIRATDKLDGIGDVVRLRKDFPWHHVFPKEKILAEIFEGSGISINKQLGSLPLDIHKAIHKGAGGGLWNQAWKKFFLEHPEAIGNAELIYKQAGWMIYEFKLNDYLKLIIK